MSGRDRRSPRMSPLERWGSRAVVRATKKAGPNAGRGVPAKRSRGSWNMCGIIGYIGSKPVVPVLLDGLRRMEDRGYDSAGGALVGEDGSELRRSAGKLSNLEHTIQSDPVDGLYGVGHTRWATH